MPSRAMMYMYNTKRIVKYEISLRESPILDRMS
jgi:hypothetical protein